MSSNKPNKSNQKDKILILSIAPKSLDLSLGILYQFGFLTVEQKRLRNQIQLITSINKIKNLPILLNQLRKLRTEGKKEKIFKTLKIKSILRKSWAENYKKYLRPFPFVSLGKGNKNFIWIDPRGEKVLKRQPNTLYLEAGLAFGTGAHSTTQLSAELLVKVLNKDKKLELLDLGCGSGVLAMIGSKLGASSIHAIDNDPVALEVARKNFIQNKIEKIVTKNSIREIRKKFDGIVANILLSTLVELKNEIIAHLKPNGFLILSGLTYKDRKELLREYKEFHLIQQKNRKGWSAFLLTLDSSRRNRFL